MPVYYTGPMPKTDEEKEELRRSAVTSLRALKNELERLIATSSHGINLAVSRSERDRYNVAVHKLLIVDTCADKSDLYDMPLIPKSKREGRNYESVAISTILGLVDLMLRKCDTDPTKH